MTRETDRSKAVARLRLLPEKAKHLGCRECCIDHHGWHVCPKPHLVPWARRRSLIPTSGVPDSKPDEGEPR